MNKVILICGKICSGKSVYAKRLIMENKAVRLSANEIMLALFGQYLGEKHEEIDKKTVTYLYKKSIEIISSGIDVILDWGFWTYEQRQYATKFYTDKGISIEWHYIDVNDDTWQQNINTRNDKITNGQEDSYFIDKNLATKFNSLFQMPKKNEMDIWYINDWD